MKYHRGDVTQVKKILKQLAHANNSKNKAELDRKINNIIKRLKKSPFKRV